MEEKVCCVTGDEKIPITRVKFVKRALRREIEKAIADGYTRFISGLAEGVDRYFVEIVSEKRKTNKMLRLEVVIPCRSQCLGLIEDKRTKALLKRCTEVYVVTEEYSFDVHLQYNCYMAGLSNRVIAVCDGRGKGGTLSMLLLAHANQMEIRKIPICRKLVSTAK